MNDLDATFARIDLKIAHLKETDLRHKHLISCINTSLSLDHVIEQLHSRRDRLLAKINQELQNLSKSASFVVCKPHIYLKQNQNVDFSTFWSALTENLRVNHELTMFKKLKYFHIYDSSEQIDLEPRKDFLYDRHKLFIYNPLHFYRIPVKNRLIIEDNFNDKLLLLDRNFNLIRSVYYNSYKYKSTLEVTSSRLLVTSKKKRQNMAYFCTFDFDLKLLNSRKVISNESTFVQFSADCICYKSRDYVILDQDLNVIGRLGDILHNWNIVLHALTMQRVVLQNNITREVQIAINSTDLTDKENHLKVLSSVKLDHTVCLKIFVDSESNVYMVYKRLNDESGVSGDLNIRCYDSNGRLVFDRVFELAARFRVYDVKGESLYFFDAAHARTIV
jgi:hypothetical protein